MYNTQFQSPLLRKAINKTLEKQIEIMFVNPVEAVNAFENNTPALFAEFTSDNFNQFVHYSSEYITNWLLTEQLGIASTEEFLARKFTRMLAILKDKKPETFDLFEEMLLVYLGDMCFNVEIGYSEKKCKELKLAVKAELSEYDDEIIKRCYKALINGDLYELLDMDCNDNLKAILFNDHYKLIDDGEFLDAMKTLYLELGYSRAELLGIFENVGFLAPRAVLSEMYAMDVIISHTGSKNDAAEVMQRGVYE